MPVSNSHNETRSQTLLTEHKAEARVNYFNTVYVHDRGATPVWTPNPADQWIDDGVKTQEFVSRLTD